jgi:glycosyltransferase involved in cell wall biosynthesis
VFFGGINVYLQQKFAVFRHTPWWLDQLLDNPALLDRVSQRGVSIQPAALGDMTVSMLRGEAGHQRKEIEKLVDWLITEVRPDVVHLSNSMMIGMARMLKEHCGPPVVCQLSGEDLFLEKLVAPHYEQARTLLRERAKSVDAFVAMNCYYADFMADYLAVDRNRIHVIPHGLRLEGHGTRPKSPRGETRAIGYLARICHDKGLHLLVDACERLARRGDVPPFVLSVAGYLGPSDRTYFDVLRDRIQAGPLRGQFEYLGELDRDYKIKFLQSLDVFSVPTVYRESKGLPALEAMANAVPVVLPDHGSFSEMIADTGGGLLFRPHDAADLADKLAALLEDPIRATDLGLAGQKAIADRYHATAMAEQTLALYRRLSHD